MSNPSERTKNSGSMTRRAFLQTAVGAAGVTAAGSGLWNALPAAAQGPITAVPNKPVVPETLVKTLHASLKPAQREVLCLPWNHPRRTLVQANWAITPKPIAQALDKDQQQMVSEILRGVTTDEWFPRIQAQMENDAAGLGNYHVALFGDPAQKQFEWVLTGRHVTLRVDGHTNGNAAFGGPIFYGHAPKDTEDPAHPGNIYWQQAQEANAVFSALDGRQRSIALLERAPDESAIKLQGARGIFPGVAIGELHRDQKALVEKVMHGLLAPYRPSDAKEAMRDITANGGLDKIHLSFYKQDDLGHDGVWDIWRLEGPAMVWHFRGAPHVHTWVNIVKDSAACEAHTDGA